MVRRVLGVVGQRSGIDPAATGRENLTLQGRLFGLRGAGLRRRVDELLDRFDRRPPEPRRRLPQARRTPDGGRGMNLAYLTGR
jgi:ABC-type multidrug transport system ATPase subunit